MPVLCYTDCKPSSGFSQGTRKFHPLRCRFSLVGQWAECRTCEKGDYEAVPCSAERDTQCQQLPSLDSAPVPVSLRLEPAAAGLPVVGASTQQKNAKGEYESSHELLYAGAPGMKFKLKASVGAVTAASDMAVPVTEADGIKSVFLIDEAIHVDDSTIRAAVQLYDTANLNTKVKGTVSARLFQSGLEIQKRQCTVDGNGDGGGYCIVEFAVEVGWLKTGGDVTVKFNLASSERTFDRWDRVVAVSPARATGHGTNPDTIDAASYDANGELPSVGKVWGDFQDKASLYKGDSVTLHVWARAVRIIDSATIM